MADTTRWAEAEFGHAELGDARRTARLVKIAARCAERPHGHVSGVLHVAAEREGAFRFVENQAVDAYRIAEASHEATARRCGRGTVIVAVDQSTLSVTDRQRTKGFGRTAHNTRRKRGVEVMTALAVSEAGVTLGVLAQQWWLRSEDPSPQWKKDKRPECERESDLWRRTLDAARATLGADAPEVQPWFQLDRGADVGAVLRRATELDLSITVRAAYDRSVEGGRQLRHAVRAAPVLGHYELRVPRGYKRKPRVARIEVRATAVRLRVGEDVRSRRRKSALDFHVVRVRELRAPRGVEPIEWTLLTTVAVDDFDDAMNVVRAYTARWRVEDFHLAWKSAVCDIESSQLRSLPAFRRWATIAAAVAARTERLKMLSRSTPDVPALTELSRDEVDAAILLSETKRFSPGDELTLEQAVRLIADLGGYTGKSSGGPPGARVIARGLHDVEVGARALALGRRRSG
jgi:Transposase DNA-binding/Transposase Tn5 dimerisation domain